MSHPFCIVEPCSRSIRALLHASCAWPSTELDPDAVPLCEASDLWLEFDATERLAASAKTLLACKVEEANSWKRAGYRSAAEQLAGMAGTSVAAAKKDLDTSKKVRKLPKTADAMRKGKLSSAKAEAIAAAHRRAGGRGRPARGCGTGSPRRSAREVFEGEGRGCGQDA